MRGAILGGMLVTLLSGIDMSSMAVLDADARWAEAAPPPRPQCPPPEGSTDDVPSGGHLYLHTTVPVPLPGNLWGTGESALRATLNSTLQLRQNSR